MCRYAHIQGSLKKEGNQFALGWKIFPNNHDKVNEENSKEDRCMHPLLLPRDYIPPYLITCWRWRRKYTKCPSYSKSSFGNVKSHGETKGSHGVVATLESSRSTDEVARVRKPTNQAPGAKTFLFFIIFLWRVSHMAILTCGNISQGKSHLVIKN